MYLPNDVFTFTWTEDQADDHGDAQPTCNECGDLICVGDDVVVIDDVRFYHPDCLG